MICLQQKNISNDKRYLCFVQNPNIAERRIDDTAFLVDPDTDIVFYLDALSSGIWHLLKEPVSINDLITIVQQAFPDTPPKKIAKDVSKLINKMHKQNLVLKDA